MVMIKSECCDCATGAYPCIGKYCPLQNQKVYICDKCKEEVDELYELDGQQLCIDCIKETLKKVE